MASFHTDSQSHTYTHTNAQTIANSRNPVSTGLQPARAWFKNKKAPGRDIQKYVIS